MDDLLVLMECLRAPDGCPWDREQTHRSIRQCFLEETYEALEAIDTENAALLEEELGDVLFQVVFHAQLEKEKNSFAFDDVVDGVVRKMLLRHPHVFGDQKALTAEEGLASWEAVKRQEEEEKERRKKQKASENSW